VAVLPLEPLYVMHKEPLYGELPSILPLLSSAPVSASMLVWVGYINGLNGSLNPSIRNERDTFYMKLEFSSLLLSFSPRL